MKESRTSRTYGIVKKFPIIGSCRRNVRMTGKKSLIMDGEYESAVDINHTSMWTYPKRFKNPNVSTNIPTNGHFKKTRIIPPKKQSVPRSFCFRAKK